jgi:hypothetical protein
VTVQAQTDRPDNTPSNKTRTLALIRVQSAKVSTTTEQDRRHVTCHLDEYTAGSTKRFRADREERTRQALSALHGQPHGQPM